MEQSTETREKSENEREAAKDQPQGGLSAEKSVRGEELEKEVPLEKMPKKQLVEKIRATEETAQANFDLYLRAQAEMDNLKKRLQREKEDLCRFSNETLIKQLLPVLDNLERAIEHSKNKDAVEALQEGVEMTLKGMKDTLAKQGLKEIEAVGEPFDPNLHEAASQQENPSVESGTVLQELQKGYVLNDRLIRPAMVIVSKRTSDTGS